MTVADELMLDTPASRPCTHRRHHEHGTPQGYRQDRCRCLDCRKANSAYENARRAHVAAYGRWTAFADTRPVRAHVLDLLDGELTRESIARRANVSEDTIRRLLETDARRMARRTANSLLSLGINRRRSASQGALWKP